MVNKTKTVMPEWNIYKNDYRIGSAKTWHKALDVLFKQENLCVFLITNTNQGIVFIKNVEDTMTRYKIIKER